MKNSSHFRHLGFGFDLNFQPTACAFALTSRFLPHEWILIVGIYVLKFYCIMAFNQDIG
jgi:hypothetical protein